MKACFHEEYGRCWRTLSAVHVEIVKNPELLEELEAMECDLENQLSAVMERWKSALMTKQEAGGCFIAPESPNPRKLAMSSSSSTADCVSPILLKDFATTTLPEQAQKSHCCRVLCS